LYSAQLDGEFEAARAELGLDPGEAAARVAALGESRRAAIEAARAALTAPEPLEAAIAETMIGAALAHFDSAAEVSPAPASAPVGDLLAHRRRRDRRAAALRPLLAAASVLVVLGVISLAIRGSSSGTNRALSSATTAKLSPNAPGPAEVSDALRDLGVIGSADQLRQALAPQYSAAAGQATNGVAPSTPAPAPTGAGAKAAPDASTTPQSGTDRCLAQLPGPADLAGVHLVATATINGRRADVAAGTAGGATYVWAYDPGTCALLLTYSSGR
jgi:hypothetical protein